MDTLPVEVLFHVAAFLGSDLYLQRWDDQGFVKRASLQRCRCTGDGRNLRTYVLPNRYDYDDVGGRVILPEASGTCSRRLSSTAMEFRCDLLALCSCSRFLYRQLWCNVDLWTFLDERSPNCRTLSLLNRDEFIDSEVACDLGRHRLQSLAIADPLQHRELHQKIHAAAAGHALLRLAEVVRTTRAISEKRRKSGEVLCGFREGGEGGDALGEVGDGEEEPDWEALFEGPEEELQAWLEKMESKWDQEDEDAAAAASCDEG